MNDRAATGASVVILANAAVTLPVFLKVTRTAGTTFMAYTSSDGVNWTPISGATVTLPAMSGNILQGIAVTSYNTSVTSTVNVDQLSPGFGVPGTVSIGGWGTPASVVQTPLPAPASVTSYPIQQTYNDASMPIATIYPDGENVTTSYTSQGWLAGLSTTQGSTTTTLPPRS